MGKLSEQVHQTNYITSKNKNSKTWQPSMVNEIRNLWVFLDLRISTMMVIIYKMELIKYFLYISSSKFLLNTLRWTYQDLLISLFFSVAVSACHSWLFNWICFLFVRHQQIVNSKYMLCIRKCTKRFSNAFWQFKTC